MIAQVQAVEAAGRPADSGSPPSERAFEVFRLVEIVGLSTRAAAQEVGLSQTRVVQLRDAVEAWIASQPSVTESLSKEQRLRLAEYKANQRLDHLYSLAVEAFRASQGEEIVRQIEGNGQSRMRTRLSHGETRYLQLAARIALQQSRVPMCVLAENPQAAAAADLPAEASNPSEEDCSPAAAEQAGSEEGAPAVEAAKVDAAGASARPVDVATTVSRSGSDLQRPVQSELELPLGAMPLAPQMSRKQRKREQRRLATNR